MYVRKLVILFTELVFYFFEEISVLFLIKLFLKDVYSIKIIKHLYYNP